MLKPASIQVLQSITNITNSVIVDYPITTIQNPSRDVIGNINFANVDEEFSSYGIFDLNSFLGALSVLDEPTINLEEGIIKAVDTDSSINFVTSSLASLEDFTTNPQKITSTVAFDSVVEVAIDIDLINRIRKGASVFKSLKDLFIVKEGAKLTLKTGNKESFSRQDNSYTINLNPTVNNGADFNIAIPIDNFLSLPAMDFTLAIKEKNGQYRVVMQNEIFEFVLSCIV